ncbi:MAG: hypothetical protein EZS28_003742 [Streblomastix strix]|uniref:Uncharacterized protein n=1 Tax=Streblomastix strix TaxID=222440 RepID=A0A5J4X047_9EUKA|nr:MAG: hypothetical protein EZS28_003742 [Streblomastix strix]
MVICVKVVINEEMSLIEVLELKQMLVSMLLYDVAQVHFFFCVFQVSCVSFADVDALEAQSSKRGMYHQQNMSKGTYHILICQCQECCFRGLGGEP